MPTFEQIDGPYSEFLGGFKIEKQTLDNEKLQELIDKVESLENYLRNIFDGHILINGQFRKINLK